MHFLFMMHEKKCRRSYTYTSECHSSALTKSITFPRDIQECMFPIPQFVKEIKLTTSTSLSIVLGRCADGSWHWYNPTSTEVVPIAMCQQGCQGHHARVIWPAGQRGVGPDGYATIFPITIKQTGHIYANLYEHFKLEEFLNTSSKHRNGAACPCCQRNH